MTKVVIEGGPVLVGRKIDEKWELYGGGFATTADAQAFINSLPPGDYSIVDTRDLTAKQINVVPTTKQ